MSTNDETTESTDDKQRINDIKTEEDEELNALLDSKSFKYDFLKEMVSIFEVFPMISNLRPNLMY